MGKLCLPIMSIIKEGIVEKFMSIVYCIIKNIIFLKKIN